MDKFEMINNYFSKIVKYHKNNLKVFTSIDDFIFTSNSKNKILLILKIIKYYDKKDELLRKIIDDFLELHDLFDTFDNINIFKKEIFSEKNITFSELENIEIKKVYK